MKSATLADIARRRPIGVGIIGANPNRGWALKAHIPTLRDLPHYRLSAVSTSRQASADDAAVAFNVPAFADPAPLLARPDVDLVVITVKVPQHAALVEAALNAGKHVLCEWPLGIHAGEAEALAALAAKRDLTGLVGLQARASPTIRYLRDLVRQGFVGRVLSTMMIGSGIQWGDSFMTANAYIADDRTGATMLSIPFGHSLDALCWVLGELEVATAMTDIVRPDARNIETGAAIRKTAADQIAVAGRLANGGVATIHYRGGRSAGTNFLWEINGTKGDLQIKADTGHLQMASPELSGAQDGSELSPMAAPAVYYAAAEGEVGSARNVAHAYALIASGDAPSSFDDAVARHRMIDSIRARAGRENDRTRTA